MKLLIKIGYLSLLAATFLACSSDAEKLTLSNFENANLVATQSQVVISNENKNALVLSLAWTEKELAINSDTYGIANTQRTDVLQVATSDNFTNAKETTEKVTSKSYTGNDLNNLALLLNLPTGAEGTLYFRIKSTIGANKEALFSNPVAVKVTPIAFEEVIKGLIYLPTKNSNFKDFGNALYSPKDNGSYWGFVYANQWDNFRIYTTKDVATATIYGSKPNSLYTLDNSDDKWDIWFDEGGYFFVEADLNTLTWKKTAVTSLVLTGDFNSWSTTATPLTYNSSTKLWTAVCDINTIGWGVKFLVNEDWAWAYTDTNADGLLERATDPNIVPESTGTYKVTVDLSNPAKLKYKFEKQ